PLSGLSLGRGWFGSRGTVCHCPDAGHMEYVHSLRPALQRHPYYYRPSDGAYPMIVRLIRDDTWGGTLVEFTLTIPFFLLLMFGLIQAGLLLWTQAGLQHGVEVATRCASVNYSAKQMGLDTSCFAVAPSDVTNDTIKQYALDHSFGLVPSISSFTVTPTLPTPGICPTNIGYVVTASAPYNLINHLFPPVTLT